MNIATYCCDNCQKDRARDSNHWFLLISTTPAERVLIIRPWDEELADRPATRHVCGQECMFAEVARFVATGKFERQLAGKVL